MAKIKSKPVFSNQDTRTWVQPDGPGAQFELYGCQALTDWSQDYSETLRIKCKSLTSYNQYDTKRTVPGRAQDPTFNVVAYTPEDDDFLIDLECPVDWQVYYGYCTSPADRTGYKKIRHFHRTFKSSQSESGIDYIGEEDSAGVEQSTAWTAQAVITILQSAVESAATGLTETQDLNDIAMLNEGRCEGDCGVGIDDCEWGIAGADATYGVSTANVWITKNSGALWELTATDPFSDSAANISAVAIFAGETYPRIVVFRGNVSGTYAARCSVSDDWGATWTEVDMGGNVNGSFVNSVRALSAGMIFAVGNNGSIWVSYDKCNSWTHYDATDTGTASDLNDIDTPDGDTIYAVGSSNTVVKSSDGGDTWSSTVVSGPADGVEDLMTVDAGTKYRVFIGGEIDANEECLWYTEDGGVNFTVVAFPGSTTATGVVQKIRSTEEAPTQHLVMVHGDGTNDQFYRTFDGGASWERMDYVANSGLVGLSVCSINLAWACGDVYSGTPVIQKMTA